MQGRTKFGRLIDAGPRDVTDTSPLRNTTLVTVAIPVVTDSFLDGNAMAEDITHGVLNGSFDDILGRRFNQTGSIKPTWKFFSVPKWDSFQDTALVSITTMVVEVLGASRPLFNKQSHAYTKLATHMATRFDIPVSWIKIGQTINSDSGRLWVAATVTVPVSHTSVAKQMLVTMTNATALNNMPNYPIHDIGIATTAMSTQYGLLSQQSLSSPRKVLIVASPEHPYMVDMKIPEGLGADGMLRGLQLPVNALTVPDSPMVRLSLNATRPVQIEIVPLRNPSPVTDVYA